MNFLITIKEIRENFFRKENIYFITLIGVIFFFDRVTKLKIINDFSEETFYVTNFINFDLTWNIGIGFGFLSTTSSFFYNLVTLIIGLVILFLFYVFIRSERIDKLIYSLILGGALGTVYDRLIYKAVPDFIDLHYYNFHWFTFNVADIFITLGILTFIIRSFFVKN